MKYLNKISIFSLMLLFTVSLFAQTKQQKQEFTKNYNQETLQEMAKEYDAMQTANLEKARALAKIHNWPLQYTDEYGTFYQLIKVSEPNTPIYYKTFNKNAARSSRAVFLHNGGGMGLNVEGQNMTAHVWDGGVARETHQEFSDGSGGTRITFGDTDASYNDHSTHVTGTICAMGVNANAKGMAPQASVISYDWFGDLTEATLEAADGMLISNHSYGADINDLNDWQIGAYTMDSRAWDKIMYQAPYYLMVCAAGNDGANNSANGDPLDGNAYFDKLYDHTTSKNNMVVANGNDLSVNSEGEIVGSISLDSSSSEGPTDDYRVKPDITGNGTWLYSSIASSDNAYASYLGTSMASPNVAGSLLLLQQLYNDENGSFMLSSTLRGLALHTADDGGMVGPDAQYGWGYMNTKKAAEAILNDGGTSEVEEMTLEDGQTIEFQVTADGVNELQASICWTDKQSDNINTGTPNDPTPVLVADLDIRLSQGGDVFEPWKLTGVNSNTKGDNNVDNFERIDVDSASGTYNVTISNKGTLATPQAFSLVLTGITWNNLSINDNKVVEFNVWPNPNTGIFNIFVKEQGPVNVNILDIMGKKVYNKELNFNNSTTNQVDLSHLTKGIYFIALEKNGQSSVKKLIIK